MIRWEEDIQAYLQRHIAAVTWQLQTPQRGFSSAQRFIAHSPYGSMFVKLGGDYRRLQILSDANLTPRLLAGGPFGNTSITVQEFVEGYHPSRDWYATNAGIWAGLMHTLYQLPKLRQTLPTITDETYQSLMTRYVGQVTTVYNPNTLFLREQDSVERLLSNYATRIPLIQGSGLVPVHGDPSADNVLVTATQVYLIDWDTLHLSDPMRDVALVLWWMYPLGQWPELLDRFQIDLNEPAQQERFYLYISVWALEVALFFANSNQVKWKQRFLHDAQRAYARQQPDELLLS